MLDRLCALVQDPVRRNELDVRRGLANRSQEKNMTPDDSQDPTTLHVQRAMTGDVKALTWVVTRFSPLLLAQARYRLGVRLRRLYDPDDLVAEAWAVCLPKLEGLADRPGRHTPVLLRFLSTTLLYRFNNILHKHIVGKPLVADPDGDQESGIDGISEDATGVVTRVLRDEARGAVLAAIEELSPRDQEVVVLRAIEQNPNQEVALLLGETPNTVAVRYKRALERLRHRLPDSIFHDL